MLFKSVCIALALVSVATAADKVQTSLYYESYCPGCEYVITNEIKEIKGLDDIMAITDLELVPYGNAKVVSRDPPTFTCQHGDKECYGNEIELCAMKYFSEKSWEFILCEETSVDFSDEGVAKCAAEAGFDAAKVLECAKGTEGPLLHLEAADKTPSHQWVPWLVVDGKVINVEQTTVLEAICDAYKGEKPASCTKSVKEANEDTVKVSLYYEVYCPGCEYIITNEIKEIKGLDDIMAITDLEMVPYGNAKVVTRDPPTFTCQHGDKECYGNEVELCAMKHFSEKYWEFVLCEETSVDFSDEGVAKCAAEAGIDASVILECAKGTEGPLLHLEAADKTPSHEYVPWLVVDGEVIEEVTVREAICAAYKGEKPASCTKSVKKSMNDKVEVSLYYESYCPGCKYLITHDIKDIKGLDDIMAITDLEMVPYGNAKVVSRDPPTFTCQHGDKECYGNEIELCAMKYFSEKYWEFILCEETSVDFSDEGVAKCATEAGIDASVILECAKGTEGPLLHLEAADKTPSHEYVPWVIVDGEVVDIEHVDVIDAICAAYKGEKPASCTKSVKKSVNEVEKVKFSLYYEVLCPDCQDFMADQLAEYRKHEDMMAITDIDLVAFGNGKIVSRDPPTFTCQHGERECYGNEVELCAMKYNPDNFWDFIMCEETSVDFTDKGVSKCASQAGIDASVILECAKGTEGPLLHLEAADKTPAHNEVPWVIIDGKRWTESDDLIEMVCAAYKGEKPASCTKKSVKEAEKVRISLYYESYCPGCESFITNTLVNYRKHEDMMAISEIELVPFGNAYVITTNPPTFECQHGEKECYGNEVELCAMKHFPEKYWDFIVCEEVNVDFSDKVVGLCASQAGIDADVILECAKGTEGPLLHLEAGDKTPEDHEYVPWPLVNGELLTSGTSLIKMVCDAYEGEKPATCSQLMTETEKVKVSFYYESYCMGCEFLITHDIKDIEGLDDIMAITDLEFVPYGNAKVVTRDPPTFTCQHGDDECYGNEVELCAIKHFPEQYWKFILCEESYVYFSDEIVARCADQAGIDASVVLECAKGTEGPLLHLEAADKTPDHKWVPWLIVDGEVIDYEQTPILDAICAAYKGEKPASCIKKSMKEAEKVKVSLYYESYCPGCEYMITNDIKEVKGLDDIMAITDLEMVPYGNAKVVTRDPPTFTCQHGDKECYGNEIELCAMKHFSEKYWEFILCEETSVDFSDEGVAKCAAEAGIDASVILECAKGTEGPLLHLEAADKTPEDHKWVPWLVVDGVVIEDEQTTVLDAICAAYKGEKPASCTKKSVKEAEKVKVSLYYESYCPGCENFITGDLVEYRAMADMMAITDLELVPYGNAKVITRDPPTFSCQHGDAECYGNYVELCAMKYFPDKWWDFVVCEETSTNFTDKGVDECGLESAVSAAKVLECAKGTEGPLLHLEAADKTPADHKWVPWVVVDGKVMGESDNLVDMVCAAYKGEKPASCK